MWGGGGEMESNNDSSGLLLPTRCKVLHLCALNFWLVKANCSSNLMLSPKFNESIVSRPPPTPPLLNLAITVVSLARDFHELRGGQLCMQLLSTFLLPFLIFCDIYKLSDIYKLCNVTFHFNNFETYI